MDLYTKTRFNKAPTIHKGRTRFDLSHSILTTFNTGDFVPIFAEPYYPGETHSLKTSSLTRLETSLHQTMDNAYVEFAFFAVPNSTVWDNFFKFLGANNDPWTQTQNYTIPQLKLFGSTPGVGAAISPGSLLNHLMLPAGDYGSGPINPALEVDLLPLRGVFQVYNDWYRDENYDSIVYFSKGDSNQYLLDGYLFNGSYFTPRNSILKVNRFKDLFSTALPAPQKGSEVTFGLTGLAPVDLYRDISGTNFKSLEGGVIPSYSFAANKDKANLTIFKTSSVTNDGGSDEYLAAADSVAGGFKADLSQASAVTVNQLRLAIAAQAISERDARGGTRLKEKIYSTWSVECPDLEIDRSEFLGGKRFPVTMMEVLQTSETGTTVLGSDAGHSKTADSSESFVRSFTNYGWILGFMYVRTARSYSQGIDRKFRNKELFDLYDPMLDNIGETAILKSELYALDTDDATSVALTNEVAGYQEAWYHLKERTNRFSGYFQPGIPGTLDTWHYGDNYNSIPMISASWLKETDSQVDRTIAVSGGASFQWSANVYFEYYATREADKYSIPNTFGF